MKTLKGLNRTIEWQNKKIKHMGKLLSRMNDRIVSVLHNQKHYLKCRAPGVLKRQKKFPNVLSLMEKKLKRLQKLGVCKTQHKKTRRVVFLCTGNEAVKLRRLVEFDFRPLLNSKINRTKNRISLNIGHKEVT